MEIVGSVNISDGDHRFFKRGTGEEQKTEKALVQTPRSSAGACVRSDFESKNPCENWSWSVSVLVTSLRRGYAACLFVMSLVTYAVNQDSQI
jgi:hypothetical protein